MSSSRLTLWLVLALALLLQDSVSSLASGNPSTQHDTDSLSQGKGRARRASSFVRIGRPSNFVRIGRPNSFVRIGKSPELADDDVEEREFGEFDDTPTLGDVEKRHSNFVRIGKNYNPMHRFIRIGREPADSYEDANDDLESSKRASSFVRIGKSDSPYGDDKRASSFVRIGKSPDSNIDTLNEILKRASHFVRIGKGASNFVRIGRGPSSFVRIGKAPSSFVRIGKSDQDEDVDALDKRANSFVRIGKSYDDDAYDTSMDLDDPSMMKRKSNFVRIGKAIDDAKRVSSFVRIGKGVAPNEDDSDDVFANDKRVSSFVRIGKGGSEDEKRASKFVRIGKAAKSMEPSFPSAATTSVGTTKGEGHRSLGKSINLANRASAFVRIGKIPSSAFVRIGKNMEEVMNPISGQRVAYRSRPTGRQSNFVRIG